ncbi:hypothetical protein [uncultured Sphingomonas sp.]|uniref:hypothetical protein n=1 Tax=uncultured Sphingomonas sp. TaxID=158754 RepID=UPI0035CC7144
MFLALLAIAAAIVFATMKVSTMATAIEDLTNEVQKATTVAASAVALITGLAGHLRENADDPDAIEALAAQLDQSTASLSTAVAANTPAQPAPTTDTALPTTDAAQSAEVTADPVEDPAPAASPGPTA